MGPQKPQGLTITRAAWSEEAETLLMPAAYGDMPVVRAEVLRGVSVLWQVSGCSVGYLVTRQEGNELVLVLGAGTNSRPLLRHVLERAKAAGLTVRTHIRREGLKRIYERLGFSLREYVMGA